MRRIRTLLFLGIWVALLPYTGFPYAWKSILFTISGLWLVYISYVFYRELKSKEEKQSFDNFSENHDFKEEEVVVGTYVKLEE